jgi:transcriptional regulator with XRE-family HTH domain
MSEFTEVTAENLKFVRGANGLNQDQVAEILGLQGYHVSNIEKGRRTLSDSEKKLLDWYFFGKIPERITAFPMDLQGVMEFDEAEWKILTMLAARDGFSSPREWIAKKIRDYLAVFDLTSKAPVQTTLFPDPPQKTTYAELKTVPTARVAEEPKKAN